MVGESFQIYSFQITGIIICETPPFLLVWFDHKSPMKNNHPHKFARNSYYFRAGETPCFPKAKYSAVYTEFAMGSKFHFTQFIDKFLQFEVYNETSYSLCLKCEQFYFL